MYCLTALAVGQLFWRNLKYKWIKALVCIACVVFLHTYTAYIHMYYIPHNMVYSVDHIMWYTHVLQTLHSTHAWFQDHRCHLETIYDSAYFAIFCNFESLKCLVSESKKCLGFFFSVWKCLVYGQGSRVWSAYKKVLI